MLHPHIKLKLKLRPDEPRTSCPADAEDDEEESSEDKPRESADAVDESEKEAGDEAGNTVAVLGTEYSEKMLFE